MASYVFLSSLIILYARRAPPESRVNYSGTPDECVYTLIAHSWHSSSIVSLTLSYLSLSLFHYSPHTLTSSPFLFHYTHTHTLTRKRIYIYISFCLLLSSPFHSPLVKPSPSPYNIPPPPIITVDCRKTTPLTRIQTASPPTPTVICPHKSEPCVQGMETLFHHFSTHQKLGSSIPFAKPCTTRILS